MFSEINDRSILSRLSTTSLRSMRRGSSTCLREKARSCRVSAAARRAALRISSRSSIWRVLPLNSAVRRSVYPTIAVRMLLKSCATPPASCPTASIFCDCSSCSSSRLRSVISVATPSIVGAQLQRDLDRLKPARLLSARIRDGLFGDELGAAGGHDLTVVAQKVRDFIGIRVEIGIGLAQQSRGRGAVDLGDRLVDQNEAPIPVLYEDQVRIRVDDLMEQPLVAAQRRALARALERLQQRRSKSHDAIFEDVVGRARLEVIDGRLLVERAGD